MAKLTKFSLGQSYGDLVGKLNETIDAVGEVQDNPYTLPAATSTELGGVKVGSNITNSSGTISLTKGNVTSALGYTPPTTNTTYGVATTSANGLMSSSDKSKLDKVSGVYYIVGTGTTEGVWLGELSGLTAYYDGLTLAYKTAVAGVSGGTTLNLNGLGEVSVVRNATTAVTTTYPAKSVIILTYTTDGSTAYWKTADYDANTNTQIRVYRQNTSYNGDYPLLVSRTKAASIATAGKNSSYEAVYGVMWDDTAKVPTLNPSTGEIKAVKFTGTFSGNAATTSAAGLMSATDKAKLDGIASGANAYSLPLAASGTRGGIKVGYTASGANLPVALSSEKAYVALTKSAVTSALGYTPLSTAGGTLSGTITLTNGDVVAPYLAATSAGHETGTYDKVATLSSSGYIRYRTKAELKSDLGVPTHVATSASNGLMSAQDKQKLDSISSTAGSGGGIAYFATADILSDIYEFNKTYLAFGSTSSSGTNWRMAVIKTTNADAFGSGFPDLFITTSNSTSANQYAYHDGDGRYEGSVAGFGYCYIFVVQ